MTFSDQNLPEISRLEEARQLVSGRFDGVLSAAEKIHLKALEAEFPLETALFRRQCGQLGAALRGLPVQPVSGLIIAGNRLDEPESLANQANRHDRPRLRRTSVLSSIGAVILTCGLLFGLFKVIDKPVRTSLDSGVAKSRGANVSAPAAGESPIDSRETSMLASSEDSLASPAIVSLSDSELPTAAGIDAVRPLLQTRHWNIVVLKVSSKDRVTAMEQIQAFVRSNGLSVPGLNEVSGQDKSAWLGVVLTSAPDSNRKFVDDAIQQGVAESADWDPREIAEASREELIDAVRRSLQFPTKSELYHGEIYFEVPRSSPSSGANPADDQPAEAMVIAAAGLNAKEALATPGKLPIDPVSDTDESRETLQTQTVLSKNASGVTLVVFQFQPDPIPAGKIESEGRI